MQGSLGGGYPTTTRFDFLTICERSRKILFWLRSVAQVQWRRMPRDDVNIVDSRCRPLTLNRMSSIVSAVHERIVFGRRTRVLAERLCKSLVGLSNVLDVGCGDGTIASLIGATVPGLSLRGIDVLVRPATKIPVEPFDGKHLALPDASVDAVMFIDVLHHTADPMVLLREANRVARRLILIKDHTMDGPLAYSALRFMDWVGNAQHGVALPYNYWTERRWREAFATLGMAITHWDSRLGLYPFPASLVFERGLHFIAALAPNHYGSHP